MPLALIVDDDPIACEALAELVAQQKFSTITAGSLAEAREALTKSPDVILLDLVLPDGNGMDLVGEVANANTEVILITGHASIQTSIEALRRGVTDYLIKPVDLEQLRGVLSRVARPAVLKTEVNSLRNELRSLGRFGRLVGSSPGMQKLYDEIGRVAPTGATVLITGESGTGKEVVAETIHELSRRKDKPFIAVNCGAISPQLMESELFGHEKGSFTGAHRQHRGFFERAHGGTLLLDEVTEMPLDLQVKLLRVLETRMVTRVGSDQPIVTDVRVVAATNRDPGSAVASGKLRQDLLYRLQVFPLVIPPLRERGEDVVHLARHFLGELNKASALKKEFMPATLERMRSHAWPGNVRELWNAVQHAFIMTDDGWIEPGALPLQLGKPVAAEPLLQAEDETVIRVSVGNKIADVEEKLILATLRQCDTKEKAAQLLGISLKTLYNRLRAYAEREHAAPGATQARDQTPVGG
jgi:DNA-binding NtrC family response regulator